MALNFLYRRRLGWEEVGRVRRLVLSCIAPVILLILLTVSIFEIFQDAEGIY